MKKLLLGVFIFSLGFAAATFVWSRTRVQP